MIILINGASSSGKTSLARALQTQWQGPLIYLSLDQVISSLPFSYTGYGNNAKEGFPIIDSAVLVGEYGYALNSAFCKHALLLDTAGFDLVIDYLMLDPAVLTEFEILFQLRRVFFVGIDCDPEVLEQRNNNRQDRIPGLSLAQQKKIHFCRERYNLSLDSTSIEPDDLAGSVLLALKKWQSDLPAQTT